jgi:DNA-binding transcriptional MerR regulator
MHLLSAGEVCRVLATANDKPFSMKTLDNWVRQGVIVPIVSRKGHGNHRVFSVVDVLAIACGRGMRASGGFTLETAAGVMRVIKTYSEERLLAEFADGKTCVTFLGEHVFPRLLNERDARAAGKEFEAKNAEMFSVTGLRPQAIDIERVYDNILSAIERGEKRKPKVGAR